MYTLVCECVRIERAESQRNTRVKNQKPEALTQVGGDKVWGKSRNPPRREEGVLHPDTPKPSNTQKYLRNESRIPSPTSHQSHQRHQTPTGQRTPPKRWYKIRTQPSTCCVRWTGVHKYALASERGDDVANLRQFTRCEFAFRRFTCCCFYFYI